MKHRIIIAAALCAAFTPLATPAFAQKPKPRAQAAATIPKKDEEGIRKTVMDFEKAWNTHDMKLLATLFREDAEFINVVGMHWRGREAIVKAHAIFHEIMFQDCRLKMEEIAIRPLGGEHAIAVATITQDAFKTPDGNVMEKGQTKMTIVLAKAAEGWEIVHGENVRIDAAAVKNDPVNGPPR